MKVNSLVDLEFGISISDFTTSENVTWVTFTTAKASLQFGELAFLVFGDFWWVSFDMGFTIAAAILVFSLWRSINRSSNNSRSSRLSGLSENSWGDFVDLTLSLSELRIGSDSLSKFLLDGVRATSEGKSGETSDGDELKDLSQCS